MTVIDYLHRCIADGAENIAYTARAIERTANQLLEWCRRDGGLSRHNTGQFFRALTPEMRRLCTAIANIEMDASQLARLSANGEDYVDAGISSGIARVLETEGQILIQLPRIGTKNVAGWRSLSSSHIHAVLSSALLCQRERYVPTRPVVIVCMVYPTDISNHRILDADNVGLKSIIDAVASHIGIDDNAVQLPLYVLAIRDDSIPDGTYVIVHDRQQETEKHIVDIISDWCNGTKDRDIPKL